MNNERGALNADVILALFAGMILAILLFPMPAIILDILLVLNMAGALFVLLLMFYIKTPLDFSSFPSLLLLVTLFRLSLNVASTRLILSKGTAGSVIQAFGQFVTGDNLIVGAVMFLIMVLINFMVITKGAGRIAEVSARFTLDAMPGKQMSIDADLNSGLIDEDEARKRRKNLSEEAEFYGSMDGASKFVKGDALAGLVITAINIIGGLAVGYFMLGIPPGEAVQKYTILTIGDGLVSQIPGLITSIGAGILVTKAASETGGGLGGHIADQLLKRPEPLLAAGGMLLFVSILPGMPFLPFAILGVILIILGLQVKSRISSEDEVLANGPGAITGGSGKPGGNQKSLPPGQEAPKEEQKKLPSVHPMVLEIGFGLVPLVDQRLNGDLVERIGMIREQIRDEMGFMIPPISIQDNLELGNNEYRIMVRGLERARAEVLVGSHLAINPGDVSGSLEGTRTIDPTFGFEAVWINPRRVDAAEQKGYTVVDCSSVITTHVTKIVKDFAAELLSRQAVSDLLENLKETNQAVIDELIPNRLTIGVVHRVLQFLLSEQVPIHDLPAVLETLSDYAVQTKDPLMLCEFCRQALKGHIVNDCLDSSGTLQAIILNPQLENVLQQQISQGPNGILSMPPDQIEALTNKINDVYEQFVNYTEMGLVLLTSPNVRPHLYRLLERKVPDLAVLSYAEVSDEIPLKLHGTVDLSLN